jgi:uncharacterized protein (DUF1501 family)
MSGSIQSALSRRELFRRTGLGFGALALNALLNRDFARAATADSAMSLRAPHFAPQAKSVIFLHMVGGPSHVDSFDPKPALNKWDGQQVPEEFIKGIQFGFIKGRPALMGSPYKFARHGQCGMEVSEQFPHIAGIADEITVVRSMVTDEFNHANAQLLMHNGFRRMGRPSMGSWVTYGLGSENQNLPGFVVLMAGNGQTNAGTALWSNGFLPSVHQGVQFRAQGDAVLNLSNPTGMSHAERGETVAAVNRLNAAHLADVGDPEIATRISQYELAYRMQSSVPELMDLSREPQSVLDAYGADPSKPGVANQCLLARRLVERGVRFVQLNFGNWDAHQAIYRTMPGLCRQIDRPAAALVRDLRQRGLLDSTLVVWSGEFGRTPMVQDVSPDGMTNAGGRDHHKDAFSLWLAGGGVKRGCVFGESDEFGVRVVRDAVHVHDLQATILHLLGLDHTRLTFRLQGRDYRLTDVFGKVVKGLLA